MPRRLLRDIPSYHDARALLGRSYGWQRRFPEARTVLTGLVQRALQFVDGYVALADIERWDERPQASLAVVDSGLRRFPRQEELLQARLRALAAIGSARNGSRQQPAPVRP